MDRSGDNAVRAAQERVLGADVVRRATF